MAQIEFSDEQAMLRATAADFCSKHSPIGTVRSLIDTADGSANDTWRAMTELGWLGIAIPETYGGLGLGLAAAVPVIESMGRHLLASPYVATTLAAHALVTCGDDALKRTWLPKIVDGAVATLGLTEVDGNWRLDEIVSEGHLIGDRIELSGGKRFVLDVGLADLIIVSVRIDGAPRLVLIEASGLRDGALRREIVIDETRRSFALDLDGVVVPRANLLPHTHLAAVEHAALLLLSAEISGGLAGVLHVVVAYLNTRKQFGRLIGSYQSLKHPTVQILLAAEAAKSHLYHAATLLARGDMPAFEIAVRIAKAHGSAAFADAGDRAVQFHGGFGFTYECDAQLFLRRALWCQYQFGDERHQRQLLAPLLFDRGTRVL